MYVTVGTRSGFSRQEMMDMAANTDVKFDSSHNETPSWMFNELHVRKRFQRKVMTASGSFLVKMYRFIDCFIYQLSRLTRSEFCFG